MNNEVVSKFHYTKKNNLLEKLKEINKLSLKERRQKVIYELKKETLNLEELEFLLLMDNTNEDLLYRYIQTLNKSNLYVKIERVSYFINHSKIKDLQCNLLEKHNLGFRNISNKEFFFQFLSTIKKGEQTAIDEKLTIMNIADNVTEINNQPFDINFNLEAFYFHISSLLATKIGKEKKGDKIKFTKYLNALAKYLSSLSNELNEYEQNQCNEKKDLKKFLMIICSIINYDYENRDIFFQVPKILKKPNEEDIKMHISMEIRELKDSYGDEEVEEFKKTIENKKIFNTIKNIGFIDDKIYIPEECYLYDYIINNNVFKKI